MKLNDEQKKVIWIFAIYEVIILAIYGWWFYAISGGKEWIEEKKEEFKERKLKRKEEKYATKVINFEEEES